MSWCLNSGSSLVRRMQWLALLAILIPVTAVNAQQDRTEEGASLFPASTDIFLKITQPGELVDRVMEHPLRVEIEKFPQIKEFFASQDFMQAKIALAFFETQIDEEWLPALKKLTEHGLFVGGDLQAQAVGIAFHSGDEALLKKTAGVTLGFLKKQSSDAFEVHEYRTGKFAKFDDFTLARFGEWFIISNKEKFAQAMADNLLDGILAGKQLKNTLATNQQFQSSIDSRSNDQDAWGFIDLKSIRDAGLGKELFRGKTDNAGTELLVGGVIEALEDAEFVSADLKFSNDAIEVNSSLPFDSKSFRDAREFFFGNMAKGRAPGRIDLPGVLGQVTTYRNLGSWWLSKEDLFPENVIAGLAKADSDLSTVFGGVDFGEEVLGALQPGLRLVVKGQNYQDGTDPDVKLPAFALIGRLQNPKDQRRFRVSFQSLIGFLNIDSGQRGRPQFELLSSKENGYRITGGEYMLEEDDEKGLMIFNFSPAIAFQDDYMIVSSTLEFAHELAEATKTLKDDTEVTESNTVLTLQPAAIKKQLEINRDSMVAQSMVEGGKSRKQAEAELDLALHLLEFVGPSHLDYRVEDDKMSLSLRLGLKQ